MFSNKNNAKTICYYCGATESENTSSVNLGENLAKNLRDFLN